MPISELNEPLMEEALLKIADEKNWSPGILNKLERFLRSPNDEALFRINPVQFAIDHQVSESEAINLLLHSVKTGLFELDWNLICAFCAVTMSNFKSLSRVHSHVDCQFCTAKNDLTLDEYIQITFTVSPQLKDIVFHHPDTLSIEDRYYEYHLSKGAITPEGYPEYEDMHRTMMVKSLAYIEPGEMRRFEVEVRPGAFFILNMNSDSGAAFIVDENAADAAEHIGVQLKEHQFQVQEREMVAQEIAIGEGVFNMKQSSTLHNRKLTVEVENFEKTKIPVHS